MQGITTSVDMFDAFQHNVFFNDEFTGHISIKTDFIEAVPLSKKNVLILNFSSYAGKDYEAHYQQIFEQAYQYLINSRHKLPKPLKPTNLNQQSLF